MSEYCIELDITNYANYDSALIQKYITLASKRIDQITGKSFYPSVVGAVLEDGLTPITISHASKLLVESMLKNGGMITHDVDKIKTGINEVTYSKQSKTGIRDVDDILKYYKNPNSFHLVGGF